MNTNKSHTKRWENTYCIKPEASLLMGITEVVIVTAAPTVKAGMAIANNIFRGEYKSHIVDQDLSSVVAMVGVKESSSKYSTYKQQLITEVKI